VPDAKCTPGVKNYNGFVNRNYNVYCNSNCYNTFANGDGTLEIATQPDFPTCFDYCQNKYGLISAVLFNKLTLQCTCNFFAGNTVVPDARIVCANEQ